MVSDHMLKADSNETKPFFQNHRINVTDEITKVGLQYDLIHHFMDKNQHLEGRSFRTKGKDYLNFGSCSYLGLEMDPRVKAGAIAAINNYGISLSSSRTYIASPQFQELEDLLQQVFGGYPVLFTSTTLGSFSVMAVFVQDRDMIVLDQYVHDSVQLAASTCLKRGVEIAQIAHNNIESLENILENSRKNGFKGNIWYCGDGVYSMAGNLCPVSDLIRLLNTYDNFYCYIDDAHGASIFGKHGRGHVLGAQDELHPKIVVAISLYKGFGVGGGGVVICPNSEWRSKLGGCGPTRICSGPMSPAMIAAAVESAKIHLSDELPLLQAHLQEKTALFVKEANQYGLRLSGPSNVPIQFIVVGTPQEAAIATRKVLDRGYYVNYGPYPAVPFNKSGMRFAINLHLTDEDIEGAVAAAAEACKA